MGDLVLMHVAIAEHSHGKDEAHDSLEPRIRYGLEVAKVLIVKNQSKCSDNNKLWKLGVLLHVAGAEQCRCCLHW